MLGKISIDRLTSDINKSSERFDSRYFCPKTEDINATVQTNQISLCHQHISYQVLSIKHFQKSQI